MKKAITILALIMMIFAVSCSNDTPAPANEVPEKADLTVATPAVPTDSEVTSDVITQFMQIYTALSGEYDEAVSSIWYNTDGEKVITQVDGDRYVTVDGDVLRAGDSIEVTSETSITVNDVTYSYSTAEGRQYIVDYSEIRSTVIRTVYSSEVEKIFTLEEEVTVEGQKDPSIVEHTMTVTGKSTTTDNALAEDPDLSELSAKEVSISIDSDYLGFTNAKLNVYEVIETPDATEEVSEPQPAKVTKYVLTVGDTAYSLPVEAESIIDGVVTAIFN